MLIGFILFQLKGNIPCPYWLRSSGGLGPQGGFLGWLCQAEAQLYERCGPVEEKGRARDMPVTSSLTPPGQHGASAPLCFSLVLPTNTLEVAVEGKRDTFESSDDSHSGPEE